MADEKENKLTKEEKAAKKEEKALKLAKKAEKEEKKKRKEEKREKKAAKEGRKAAKAKKTDDDKSNITLTDSSSSIKEIVKPGSLKFPSSLFGDYPDLNEENVQSKFPDDAELSDLADKHRYIGMWNGGQPTGWGNIKFALNDEYFGQLKNCQFQGFGLYLHNKSGARIYGHYDAGKLNGYGVYKRKEGIVEYRGDFVQDKRTGLAVEQDSLEVMDGVYIGEFLNGVRKGRGRSIIQQTHACIGIYDQNELVYGLYRFPSGTFYVGDFELGQPHGIGRMTHFDGRVYIGKFVDGQRQGEGTAYDEDDNVEYCGHWRANKKHGRGFIAQPGNTIREAQFIDDSRTRWHSGPQDIAAFVPKKKKEDFEIKEDFKYVDWDPKYEADLLEWMEDDFKMCHPDRVPSGLSTGEF